MARFEIPIDNPEAARLLRGLDRQSVMIARSPEQRAKLCHFFFHYVRPDILSVDDLEGAPQRYAHQRFSAVGGDGSLLHVRVREHVPGQSFDESLGHVAIISHLDDPNEATTHFISEDRRVHFDGTTESVFKAIAPAEQGGLQVVEGAPGQIGWDIEKALMREANAQALPEISITGRGWLYQRSDGHLERLSDMHGVRERVALATFRGLGSSAALAVSGQPVESGQFEQKMVV